MGVKKATNCHLPDTLVIGGRKIDKRTLEARRYLTVCGDLADDVGEPSAGQWLLIHRIAALTVQLETMDAQVAQGKEVDTSKYSNLTSTLIRSLTTLGFKKQAKEGSPATVIDSHAQAVREAQS